MDGSGGLWVPLLRTCYTAWCPGRQVGWLTRGMVDLLAGLDKAERAACHVAERVTGATARAWDTEGRNGVVDAFLDYADGRTAAFEVTRIATNPLALQLDNLLGRDSFEWPLPGRWWWTLWVSDVRELPRLRRCFNKVVLLCEAAHVVRPEDLVLGDREDFDEDLRWWVEDSSASLHGHPDIPSVDGERVRKAMVTPAGDGGLVDDSLSGLDAALVDAFSVDHLRRRVEKLVRTRADERHLFAIVHHSDLCFEVTSALMFGTAVPSGPAWLPNGISHLWLAPAFSRRVLLGTASGWSQAFPYDN